MEAKQKHRNFAAADWSRSAEIVEAGRLKKHISKSLIAAVDH